MIRYMAVESTDWDKDPDDGVLCLLATRRVLDAHGHCCDYRRCPSLHSLVFAKPYTQPNPLASPSHDRCILDIGHEGPHHGVRCWRWK